MPKHTVITEYHVRVDPVVSRFGRRGDRDILDDEKRGCERIVDEIRRHVLEAVASVVVERESVCEYCGSKWTEDSDLFNGGCCDQDMEHEPVKRANQC